MQSNYRRLLALLLAAALVMALAGCGGKEQEGPTGATLSEEEIWGTAPAETLGIAVENEYMTFHYPQEWEGKVEEVRESSGANTVVSFRTKISGKELVLFSIVLGPDEVQGFLLGDLVEGSSRIHVYSVMNEQNAADWSEEEYSEICSLQERVNDIIVQFYEDSRFDPND